MRLLQISNKIPFVTKDGGAIAINNLLKGFIQNGHQVSLIAMNTSKHFMDEREFKNKIPEKLNCHVIPIDTGIKPLQLLVNFLFKKSPYILDRFYNKTFEEKLIHIIKNGDFDIIQLEGLYVTPYISVIRKFSKAKISYRSHNIESLIWQNNLSGEVDPFKRLYLKSLSKRLYRIEKQIINKYDFLVPITLNDSSFFESHGNIKPSCITPFGVDIQDYQPENKQVGHNTLFYIGALDWIPNINGLKWFVENIWIDLKSKFPGLAFKVAGRNAGKPLENYLIENNVSFLGEIADSKSYFLHNNIMVVPLFAGSGMRIKIIEGMAYAKTIVSTGKGAEGITFNDGKDIFIANTANEFIANITMLLQDKKICDQTGSNARSMIEKKYNNQTICENLLKFYKDRVS